MSRKQDPYNVFKFMSIFVSRKPSATEWLVKIPLKWVGKPAKNACGCFHGFNGNVWQTKHKSIKSVVPCGGSSGYCWSFKEKLTHKLAWIIMWFTQIYPAKGDILVVGMTDHPIKPSFEQLLGLEMLLWASQHPTYLPLLTKNGEGIAQRETQWESLREFTKSLVDCT